VFVCGDSRAVDDSRSEQGVLQQAVDVSSPLGEHVFVIVSIYVYIYICIGIYCICIPVYAWCGVVWCGVTLDV